VFVEDPNRAMGLHGTKEMDTPRSDRQGGRQGAPQGGVSCGRCSGCWRCAGVAPFNPGGQ
jgi:hypothetical protein